MSKKYVRHFCTNFDQLISIILMSFWTVLQSLQLEKCATHLNKNKRTVTVKV